ncbi:MAG: hypothetical protein CSA22_09390 [Deltaproteobacteria bacterium]|nr:MAG: hypothetical protein CSA22_09390 [Deltaproteobacteria bacterium]
MKNFFFLFLALMLTGVASPVFADEKARINNMTIQYTDETLAVDLDVTGAFINRIDNAIQSGVPTTFSFFISLHQVRKLWMDKKLAAVEVVHTITYDPIKKKYTVNRSWDEEPPLITDDYEAARILMTHVKGLTISDLDVMKKGKRYTISAKAELNKRTLPLRLHQVLIFMALWDFETKWKRIEFTY